MRRGNAVLVQDESAVQLAAGIDSLDPRLVSRLSRLGHGGFSVVVSPERADSLSLVGDTPDGRTAQRVGHVDWSGSTESGLAAADRERTARWLVDPSKTKEDFVRSGSVGVFAAGRHGGFEHDGPVDAAYRLALLAGHAGAVVSPLLTAAGTFCSASESRLRALELDVPIVSVDEVACRLWRDAEPAAAVVSASLPTTHGDFTAIGFEACWGESPHLALQKSDGVDSGEAVIEVHRACVAGGALGSRRCDCRDRLDASLERLGRAARGALIYLADQGHPNPGPNGDPLRHLRGGGRCTDDPLSLEETGEMTHIVRALGLTPALIDSVAAVDRVALERMGLESAETKGPDYR